MANDIENPEIDFLILADRAEVLNGKLYMMGGGYDRKYISNIEAPIDLTIVMGILVPWNSTNREVPFNISIETDDGMELNSIKGSFKMGRPAIAEEGQSFRVMSVATSQMKLPGYGAFRIVARAGEGDRRTTTFYALLPQAAPART